MIPVIYYYQQNTLNDAIKQLYWRAEQRGPLLVVGLEQEPKQPLPPVSASGYNAQELAGYFDRVLIKAGEVTVLAPRTMRLFTKPTLAPEQAMLYSRYEAGSAFLGSLSKTQLDLLLGERGLGWSDISGTQQPLFLALLPKSLTLDPVDTTQPKRTITDNQRKSLRLRVAPRPLLTYFIEGTQETVNFGEDHTHGLGYYLLTSADEEDENGALLDKLFPAVPNRLKPSALSFTSPRLDRQVALAEAPTIRVLLERIGAATGLHLSADYRIADRIIQLRGTSARAGDLLQALCLAVCGTLRQIEGTTYLLTEDQEGLAVRQAAYERWLASVQALTQARQEARNQALRKLLPKGTTPPLQRVAVDALPPELKAQVAADQKKTLLYTTPEGATQVGKIRTDQVLLELRAETQVLFPGIAGGFPTTSLNLGPILQEAQRVNEGPPPLSLITHWKERVLTLVVAMPDEARDAVVWAKVAGITELRLAVPASATVALPLLKAGRSEGERVGLRVRAQVFPLAQPKTTSLPQDRSLLGEPEAPLPECVSLLPSLSLIPTLKKELALLGGVPLEPYVVGYSADNLLTSYRALGYTEENRRAVLKVTGSDLLDLPHHEFASLPIPLDYFAVIPDASPVPKQARALRQASFAPFLAALGNPPVPPPRSLRVPPDATVELLRLELEELPRTLPELLLDFSAVPFRTARALLEGVSP